MHEYDLIAEWYATDRDHERSSPGTDSRWRTCTGIQVSTSITWRAAGRVEALRYQLTAGLKPCATVMSGQG